MKPLGSGSIAVYNAIEEFYSLNGYSPSYKQIMLVTSYPSKASIAYHLDRLAQAGWIIREQHSQRTIIPVHYPRVYYRRAADPIAGGWLYTTDAERDPCSECNAVRQRNR